MAEVGCDRPSCRKAENRAARMELLSRAGQRTPLELQLTPYRSAGRCPPIDLGCPLEIQPDTTMRLTWRAIQDAETRATLHLTWSGPPDAR